MLRSEEKGGTYMYFDKAQEQFYPNDPVFYCENCEEKILDEDNIVFTGTGKTVCQHCADTYYERCFECGELYPTDDMICKGYLICCENCFAELED